MVSLALLSYRGKEWSDRFLVQVGVVAVVAILLSAFSPQIISFLSRENPQAVVQAVESLSKASR